MKTDSIFFVEPESVGSNQLSSSGIKREPRDVEDECHDLNQLSTPIIKREPIDVEDGSHDLNQLSMPIEFVNIKNESYDISDATPRTADLKFCSVFIKEENYGNLENFEDSSQNECSSESENIFSDLGEKSIVSSQNLKSRYKIVPEVCKYYPCKLCNRTFPCKEDLKLHKKTYHVRIACAKCSYCDKSFTTKASLKLHEKTIHLKSKDWKCNLCDKIFSDESYLKKHEKSMHLNDREYKCDICEKAFSHNGTLKKHKQNVHFKIKKWKCNICEKCFAKKSSLNAHGTVHIKDYVEGCDICGKLVRCVKSHKYYMHSGPEAMKFKCDHCDKRLINKKLLIQHLLIHTDARDWECKTCGKGYKSKRILTRHEKIHLRESSKTFSNISKINLNSKFDVIK